MRSGFIQTALALLASTLAAPALAGPPYDTDDPVPTERGDWEIYGFAAVAVTRSMSKRLLLGIEATRSGADATDGRAVTTLGIGGIRRVGGPFSVLVSGGPTREDGTPTLRYHGNVALGVAF